MPTYDKYPAVDENFNFPPQIRSAFSRSQEFMDKVSDAFQAAQFESNRDLYSNYVMKNELSGLLPWKTAYANRASQPAKVFVTGSNEGQGATGRTNRWMEVLSGKLAAGYQRSVWLRPSKSNQAPSGTQSKGLTLTGTYSLSPSSLAESGVALKGHATDRGTATFSASMTRFTVWYTQNNFFTSDAEVYVDDVLVGTIAANGPQDASKSQTFTTTAGSRTVKIVAKNTSESSFELNGVEYFPSISQNGITVYDGTRFDLRMRDISTSSYDSNHNKTMGGMNPNLVIVMAGDVDYLTDSIGFSEQSIADIVPKFDNFIAGDHSVLFVLPPRPVPPSGVTRDPAQYAILKNILAGQARLDPEKVAFLDMGEFWPRLYADGTNSLGLMVETSYPKTYSNKGQLWLAEVLYQVLT